MTSNTGWQEPPDTRKGYPAFLLAQTRHRPSFHQGYPSSQEGVSLLPDPLGG